MTLTGRQRYRISFTGLVVLQVEEEGFAMWPYSTNVTKGRRWRDAHPEDLMPAPTAALTLEER